jgi:uncharacterized protein YjbI with pentapeptide repeats
VDFDRSVFSDADLSNAKLAKANLTKTGFRNVKLTGADLSGIKKFEQSTWQNVEWWKAKCISPELYDYLEQRLPIRQDQIAASPAKTTSTNCGAQ